MEPNVAPLPLSDKAWAWLQQNTRPALWGAGIVAVGGLLLWFVLYQRAERQVAAGEALSNLELKQNTAPGGANPNDYLQLAATYANSSAGARALLLAATSLFNEGKFAEAQTQFERFTREYRSSLFVGEALLGVATCLEAQGKPDQAIAAYKDLVEHHPGDPGLPQAKFALGRLYAAQGKPDQARNFFDDVRRTEQFGTLGSEAARRLQELLAKYPQLAAAPAPATNAPALRIEPPK